MNKSKHLVKFVGFALAVAAAVAAPGIVAAAGGPPTDRGAGTTQGAYVVSNPLDADEQAGLVEFLLDEHKALATYESIMADFGEIEPFASIAQAETRHIAALERVFDRYDVALPEIPSFDIPAFASPEEAAAAGVQAEIDNAALYDRLMSTIDNPDVVRVATNLRDASLNHHLPAFQAFVDGTYVEGQSMGTGSRVGGGMMAARGRNASAGSLGTPTRLSDGGVASGARSR